MIKLSWFKKEIEEVAIKVATDYLKSSDFEKFIIEAMGRMPDDLPMTKVGFLGKMAFHIFKASNEEMAWNECKEMAWQTWCDFSKDNKVKFDDPGWDWDGNAARTLVHEYQISYW